MNHFQFVVLQPEHTAIYFLEDDGVFPNHASMPVVHYIHAFQISAAEAENEIKQRFGYNKWGNAWKNGVYDYHHYHSTAHEVLAACSGKARLQLGGPAGIELDFNIGDVLLLPAGIAHKCLDATGDFECIGAYPEGQQFDMNYGKPGERPAADDNIRNVPLPVADPVYGGDGPLMFHWNPDPGRA